MKVVLFALISCVSATLATTQIECAIGTIYSHGEIKNIRTEKFKYGCEYRLQNGRENCIDFEISAREARVLMADPAKGAKCVHYQVGIVEEMVCYCFKNLCNQNPKLFRMTLNRIKMKKNETRIRSLQECGLYVVERQFLNNTNYTTTTAAVSTTGMRTTTTGPSPVTGPAPTPVSTTASTITTTTDPDDDDDSSPPTIPGSFAWSSNGTGSDHCKYKEMIESVSLYAVIGAAAAVSFLLLLAAGAIFMVYRRKIAEKEKEKNILVQEEDALRKEMAALKKRTGSQIEAVSFYT